MRYGVLDIGSNSVKFLAAEQSGTKLIILREESYATRLAEDLIATARLKPEAIDRTLEVFSQVREIGETLGIDRWLAVATSAVRDAGNRKEFLKAAVERLKCPVRLLSGDEEAETIYRGVVSDPALRGQDIFAVDVGGGSTEWIQGSRSRVERRQSLPLGCVRLRERFVAGYPLEANRLQTMMDALRTQLRPVLGQFALGKRQLVGTGGTITASATLIQGLAEFDPAKIHLLPISLSDLIQKMTQLSALSLDQLAKVTGLPRKRIDIMVPGLAVFCVTMELLGSPRLLVSVRGLRYGVLEQLIEEKSDSAR